MPPAAPHRLCIVSGHSSLAGPQFGAAASRLNIRPLHTLACVSAIVACRAACRAVGVILGAFPTSLGWWARLPTSPLAVAAALFLSLRSVLGWVPALPTSCWSPHSRRPTRPIPAVSPADPVAGSAATLRIGDPPAGVLAAQGGSRANEDVGDSLAVIR
jgi:hypothetical protein